MRWLIFGVVALHLALPALAAQGSPSLARSLDSQTLAALRPILDSARRDSVPVRPLEDKALEGVAKHVAPLRILAAVRQLRTELKDARTLLHSAAPAVVVSEEEIVAAADAQRRGVPAPELATLRRHAPPTADLIVAYTLLGDLVQRGVPSDQARVVIEQLLAAGVPPAHMAEIPARMDVGLRVGAAPLDALRNALPTPLRPPQPLPPTGTPPRPVPNRPSHP
jgi:hypothetical protein